MVMSGDNVPAQHGLARIMTNGERVYEDHYVPRSILLTGGAGFIGSHVAILLAKQYPDYKVSKIDHGNFKCLRAFCEGRRSAACRAGVAPDCSAVASFAARRFGICKLVYH